MATSDWVVVFKKHHLPNVEGSIIMKIKDRPEFSNKLATFTLSEDAALSDAIATMANRNIGSVIVVDGSNKVTGIFTERDLLRRVLAQNLNPATTKIASVMTSSVMTAKPDDSVIDWLRIMSNERFRHLPVVDDDGKLITVMSQGDFVSYTWPDLLTYLSAKATETVKGPSSPIIVLMMGLMLYSLLMVAVMKYI